MMPEYTLLEKRSLGGLPVYHLSQALESESIVSVHVTCIVVMSIFYCQGHCYSYTVNITRITHGTRA